MREIILRFNTFLLVIICFLLLFIIGTLQSQYKTLMRSVIKISCIEEEPTTTRQLKSPSDAQDEMNALKANPGSELY